MVPMIRYALPEEKWLLYSQIGLRPVDEFTGSAPRYPVYADLEYLDGAGGWRRVDREPEVTPSGVISFPELGRSAYVSMEPVVRHRVVLRSNFYRPAYLRSADGIEFDVHPYDDTSPPAVIPTHARTEPLFPGVCYGYPSHVRVVRGLVLDVFGDPVVNVEVSEGVQEKVLTDERGAFALPLRWPALHATVSLDALDHRTGRTDTLSISLPADLAQGHLFTIT